MEQGKAVSLGGYPPGVTVGIREWWTGREVRGGWGCHGESMGAKRTAHGARGQAQLRGVQGGASLLKYMFACVPAGTPSLAGYL